MSVQKSNMPRQGVVKFTPEQLNNVVDAILSTANKVQVPRCGASYLLFMALRHTDNTNDDNLLKVRTSPYQMNDRALRTIISNSESACFFNKRSEKDGQEKRTNASRHYNVDLHCDSTYTFDFSIFW